MLFAPFFAGAAGTGHVWFWREAIDRPQLWYHFQRFQRAVAGLDPPAEDFQPVQAETAGLRVYALRGRRTLLAWCRDGQNDWRTELEQGTPPRKITGLALDLALLQPRFDLPAAAQVYDPWQDRLSSAGLSGSSVQLPAFERSLVLRITAGGQLPQTR
jgi:hypothetical protein